MKHLVLSLAIALTSLPAFAANDPAPQAQLQQYEKGATDLAALAQKGTTVVFFFASWCPNCIMTLTELSKNWDQVDPAITLVIADYDSERELKARYGVTYQDTFVLLDSEGNAAKLWNAGGIEGLNRNAGAQ